MSLEESSYIWRIKMSRTTHRSKKLSSNHVGLIRYNATIKQVRLRIELLNQFIRDVMPEGFTAHKSLKALLAYKDEEKGIEPRSYPAIYNKKAVLVTDIDPSNNERANEVVDCKNYLKDKIEKLKSKLESDNLNNNTQNLHDTKPKAKTKAELKATIKKNAVIVNSLAQELLRQRAANQHLVKLLHERDKGGRSLREYYTKHQQSLCAYRETIVPEINNLINELIEISKEINSVTIDDNVTPFK